MAFRLPQLEGTIPGSSEVEDIIYFGCDFDYFDRHGIALAKSVNYTLSWMHVHCHLVLSQGQEKMIDKMYTHPKFTYTYEIVNEDFYKDMIKNKHKMRDGMSIFKTNDLDFIAKRTYLASCRFMRIQQLFKNPYQCILQLDCDTILKNGFHQSKFRDIANHVGVMPKPKDPATFIASALTLGTGPNGLQFRELFANRLIEGFKKGVYWYIDQEVLKNVIKEWVVDLGYTYEKIPYKWNSWGQKRDDVFSTGKGSKKDDRRFKSAQLKWVPAHWRKPLEEDIRREATKAGLEGHG